MIAKIALTLILPFAAMIEARACGSAPSFAFIHSALPKSIPEQFFVAKIEIEPGDPLRAYTIGLKARVLKVVSGVPAGDVILRVPEATSCDDFLANGRTGFIIGIPTGWSDKSLIVQPILVSRSDIFRLSDDVNFNGILSISD